MTTGRLPGTAVVTAAPVAPATLTGFIPARAGSSP